MKKTIKSLLAIAIAAFALSACSDVPEPAGYSIQPKGGTSGGGEPAGTGTVDDPFNVAAAIAKCKETGETATSEKFYIKGIANSDYTVGSYKNIDADLVDEGSSTVFKVYHCKGNNAKDIPEGYQVKKGDVFIVYGPVVNYKNNTPETASGAYIVSINGTDPAGGGSGGGGDTPAGPNLLTNGDFETWAEGLPTHWKTTSSAGNATLTQSTDAHAGSYSVSVGFDAGTNKRMGYEEITLKAGTYTYSFFAKSTTTDASQTQAGYVDINAEGKPNKYTYGGYVSLNNTSWTEVSTTFTLSADTKVSLLMMSPKTSSYATAQAILVDDAKLVTSDGGIIEGGGGQGGDTPTPPSGNHGTVESPLTVAQAIAVIDAEATASDCYVKGIICQVDSYNSKYGSITYWISDDGGTTTKLEVYGGLNINGDKFASKDDLQTGKTVVINGNLKKYNDIYEFDLNSKIISIK